LVAIPDVGMPGPDYAALVTRPDDFAKAPPGRSLLDPPLRAPTHPAGEPFRQDEVERMVAPLPTNPRPDYPPSLIRAQVMGEVVVQFVVDSTGSLDPATVRVLRSTHALFLGAVRKVLPRLRFLPAEVGGNKVPVLVEQPFIFVLR
jgi:protein TonB